ncbi:hypothetical protein GR197_02240 [Rhizobium phaseoli]|uniref:Uncharacterized protein n=1 Tax=Rhizobium phaseoli TaxID=396 RepID=A0A7K3U7Q5_9HYPH|nr:hypothetical protein [Rhizobium phaseoli]NEJ69365.1 hypothetical protein [Rhizobium phaseoli]
MSLRRLSFVCFALLFVISTPAAAEDRRSFGVNEPLPGEDPTCGEANRAFENTYNSGRYSSRIYLADGSLFAEHRFNGKTLYERKEEGGIWSLFTRFPSETVTDAGPVLTDCKLISYEKNDNTNVGIFSARWHRDPYYASVKIWLSTTDRLVLKTERLFAAGAGPFPTQTAVDVFETDRDKVVVPSGFLIDHSWIR